MVADPAALPLHLRVPDATADGGMRTVLLDADRALVMRRRAGVDMRIAVPVKAYLGVAARVVAAPGGGDRLEIALVHTDPDLDVLLYHAEHDGEIVAQWRRWAAALDRPLLFERVDGSLVALERRVGTVHAAPPLPRRPRVGRDRLRPRFFRRRAAGRPLGAPLA
jgi:hypothetical protein